MSYKNILVPSHGSNFDTEHDSRFFVNGKPIIRRRTLTAVQKRAILLKKTKQMNDLFKNFHFSNDSCYNSAVKMSFGSDSIQQSPFPIDAVFTWVENTPEHEINRKAYSLQCEGGRKPSDNNNNRYNDNEELRYAIRSIYQNAPWFRRIFIIVDDQQCPKWLADESAKAKIPTVIVPHSFLYGMEFKHHLPTFNSQSIECHLHRIDGLADHFVYFNDDMFINQPLSWFHFFTARQEPKYNFTGIVQTGPKTDNLSKHAIAWINNSIALDKVFPRTSGQERKHPAHQCIPMLKKSFQNAWEHPLLSKYFNITSASRFRDRNNMYIIGFLCHWNINYNLAVQCNMTTLYVQIADYTNIFDIAKVIIERRPTLLCLNDGLIKKRKQNGELVRIMLNNLFPSISPVENFV
jgi:hypothetical protein